MAEKSKEKKDELRGLWMLLFENPQKLSDKQITNLLKKEDELRKAIEFASHFPEYLRTVQNYRAKKKEFSKLSTEELQTKMQEITNYRQHVLETVDDEELDDSFFESPPIDSDGHILYELLKERKAEP